MVPCDKSETNSDNRKYQKEIGSKDGCAFVGTQNLKLELNNGLKWIGYPNFKINYQL